MNRLRKTIQWLWNTKERLVLGIMVAVLAYQLFGILRTEDDSDITFPPNPRREADVTLLEPAPPADPPEIPPQKIPEDPVRLSQNDPFDWRERDRAGGADAAELGLLRLLAIRGSGDAVYVQIQTDVDKRWYKVGDAFRSYELLSVDVDAQTAEVFDESINRARVIELEE